mmetsp:Transcript_30766/g.81932  ORF Transcript_30766/g.81932 Transcript_30766/m.81932 type:complete len:201 (-) Transcript_30766:489-1091(-)
MPANTSQATVPIKKRGKMHVICKLAKVVEVEQLDKELRKRDALVELEVGIVGGVGEREVDSAGAMQEGLDKTAENDALALHLVLLIRHRLSELGRNLNLALGQQLHATDDLDHNILATLQVLGRNLKLTLGQQLLGPEGKNHHLFTTLTYTALDDAAAGTTATAAQLISNSSTARAHPAETSRDNNKSRLEMACARSPPW